MNLYFRIYFITLQENKNTDFNQKNHKEYVSINKCAIY